MTKILKVDRPGDYCDYISASHSHPLVSVIDFRDVTPIRSSLNNYGVYAIFMHKNIPDGLKYGCGRYDYKSGTLICVAPGQIGGKEDDGVPIDLDGWAILFHPDLLHGSHLEKTINGYSFFDYQVNEALHTSDEEFEVIASIMSSIKREINAGHDAVQDKIIVSYIEVLLNYCKRFYERQFNTRTVENSDVLVKFNSLLRDYFDEGLQHSGGIPGVQYFADKLCISSNYFSDLVKRVTGDTASNHIRNYIIRLAKEQLASGLSIAEVAYNLGFEYPQHFSRMFKKQTGQTPTQYLRN